MGVRLRGGLAVRASGTAGLGAGAQGLVDNGLDGARASAAFGAAAEAAIDLLGIAGKILRGVDGAADIMVADDVTGTNNHETGRPIGDAWTHRYSRPPLDAKGKTVFSSNSKLSPQHTRSDLKTANCARSNAAAFGCFRGPHSPPPGHRSRHRRIADRRPAGCDAARNPPDRAPPFIDHSNEMWNFYAGQTSPCPAR